MAAWAVVVAGGTGSRYGGMKQFEQLGPRSVLEWSFDAARTACDGVVLVLPPSQLYRDPGADRAVAGGLTRSQSVRAGLMAVPPEADIIVVHDAVRPLARRELFLRVIAAVRTGWDGAVPCLPVADTLKRVADGRVAETLPREGLACAQTPQAFRAEALRRAHRGDPEATDDASLVEACGGQVVAVPADPRNIKLTGRCDLAVAAALLEQ